MKMKVDNDTMQKQKSFNDSQEGIKFAYHGKTQLVSRHRHIRNNIK